MHFSRVELIANIPCAPGIKRVRNPTSNDTDIFHIFRYIFEEEVT